MSIFDELNSFYTNFKFEKGIMGFSFLGKPIKYLVVEKSPSPKILCQYSIHAREYITTYLSFLQVDDFIKRGKRGKVYFIPLVNMDGVEIATSINPLYKANCRGVDLNVNFDALWGKGQFNVNYPSSENFIGQRPFSETETCALRDFTLSVMPDITVSYHSKGEEIYYEFTQNPKRKKRDKIIAKKLAKTTGYSIKSTPNSVGGYKDWCIDKLKIPSFTLEVGSDLLSHPIPKDYSFEIFNKNKNVLKVLTEKVKWI